jgi:hypothetical protein
LKSFKYIALFFVSALLSCQNYFAQSDSTEINQSGYFLTFVKKVYLNPTVKIRTKAFKTKTNLEFVALPDLASEKTNASTGFEKGLQKVLRFLMQSDGGVRFYFNPDSTTHPFRFWSSENLWCKFKQADLDSIDYYLNHNFADGNISMTNALRFETTIDKALDYIEKCLTANPQACGEEPQNETTEINTKPLSVSLHNRVNSKYDIDVKQYEKLESNYAKAFDIHTQQDWYAPSKLLVANETAEPVALAIHSNEGDFLKQNIKIEVLKTLALLPIDQASTEDSLFFSLPSSMPAGDPVEVIVKYKSLKDSLTYTVGFFMVNVMERETKNLVLIPANGFVISTTFKDSVENELEKIYGQASVDFNVTIETGLAFPNDYPTTIEIESSGLFSNYTSDLRDYVGEVQDLENYDEENYYLIIGLESSELQGYMPRARNIGFIFKGAVNKPKVITHEIGHGAFHFRHIFSEEELGEEEQGSTHNIMDYPSLYNPQETLYEIFLHQWNFIKNPAFVSWFGGDDEDAEMIRVNANQIPLSYKNSNGTYTFLAPDLRPITLPSNLSSVTFSTSDPLIYTSTNQLTGKLIPLGTIIYFSILNDDGSTTKFELHGIGGNKYVYENKSIVNIEEVVVTPNSSGNSQNNNSGNQNQNNNNQNNSSQNSSINELSLLPSWDNYKDVLSKEFVSGFKIITGFAFYEDDKISFNIYSHLGSNTGINNTKSEYILVEDCFSAMGYLSKPEEYNDYLAFTPKYTGEEVYKSFFNTNSGTKVSIDGGLSVNDLSTAAKAYLKEFKDYTTSDNILAPILVAISQWVTEQDLTESYSKCLLSDLPPIIQRMLYTKNSGASQPLNFNPTDPYVTMEENEIQNELNAANNDALFDAMNTGYKRIREIFLDIANGSFTETEINTIVANATTSEQLIQDLTVNDFLSICAFENLTIDNRIKAINLFEPANEEELIIKLISSTKYNAQATALVDRVFEANSSGQNLFEKLWDRIDGQEFHQFIQKMCELSLCAYFGQTPQHKFELGNRTYVWAENFWGNFDNRYGDMHIQEIDYEWIESSDKFKFQRDYEDEESLLGTEWTQYNNFSYNEVIEIEFSGVAQDILKFDNDYTNKKIALPAFMLAYLIHKRNQDENMKVIRIVGNTIAIALAIPSGGTSLSIGAAITIGLAATDIIITCNEDELEKTDWGKDILEAWDYIQWADLASGALSTGKALYKGGTKFMRNFKFVYSELDAKIVDDLAKNGTETKDILTQLRVVINRLENAGYATWASLIQTKIIARMEGTIVKAKFSSISESATLTMKNDIEGIAQIAGGQPTKLFDMKLSSSGGAYIDALPNKTIQNLAPGDQIVGRIKKTRIKENGAIVEKEVEIVKTSDGLKLKIINPSELLMTFKNKLISRIQGLTGFSIIHTDAEIIQIITRGRDLNLANDIVDDMLLISCRNAKPINASELMTQMDNWVNVINPRGFPYKFTDIGQFNSFKNELKSGLNEINVTTSDVRIQGSSLRTPNANDLDIAAIVSTNEFNQFLKSKFSGKITKNGISIDISNYSQSQLQLLADEISGNSTFNAVARTFERAFKSGKIRPQDISGLDNLKNVLKISYGDLDISVLREAGDFDLKPYIKIQ